MNTYTFDPDDNNEYFEQFLSENIELSFSRINTSDYGGVGPGRIIEEFEYTEEIEVVFTDCVPFETSYDIKKDDFNFIVQLEKMERLDEGYKAIYEVVLDE